MKITIITLFPRMFEGFLTESIVGRARKRGQVEIAIIDLRAFAKDSYGTVDDRPYGGGTGMVLRVDVLHACLQSILGEDMTEPSVNAKKYRQNARVRVILTSAKGKTYSQVVAEKYAWKFNHLVIIAGHYEGVDERVMHFVDDEISIGKYIVTGGELPASIIADSVVRLLPGVLAKADATQHESYSLKERKTVKGTTKVRRKEHPHYTRPEEYMGMKVPDVLTSGDHQKIRAWRLQEALKKANSP